MKEAVASNFHLAAIVVENNNTLNWLQRKLKIFLTKIFWRIFLRNLKICMFKRQKVRQIGTAYSLAIL